MKPISDEKLAEGVAKFGIVEGYRWVKVSPVSNWQIIEIRICVGDAPEKRKGLHAKFMGLSMRLNVCEFVREYPDAEWGDRVERKSIHMPSRVGRMSTREEAAVYSHQSCPFHYCDQPAPHDACKLRGGCRHNPTEGNHG